MALSGDPAVTAERWRRICVVFEAAAEIPAEQRGAWLEREAAGDAELREAVERMLRSGEEDAEFLERPALGFAGSRLGAWRTVREIGRGGMGIVFLGERADGLYEQQVAIKIAPGGVHSETAVLARLEHPSIARLLDAGETPEGFPYLVMEYVEGVAVDEWVRRDNPSEAKRLEVFREICAAVHYAHQNLILHRDLKPSNVLITAVGKPKLLDFGIAKELDGAGTVTQFPAATPEYASPEQLLAEPLTTASDVYTLGLLLHTMLAGVPARDVHGMSLRSIVEQAAGDAALDVQVEGDPGQVIAKATRAAAGERYGSAAELAADVRRYQEGLPVEARAPSWGYRARRFAARNKGKVGVTAAVALLLTGATGVALHQARTADRRFQQVRRLAGSVLYDIHDSVAQLPGSNPARLLLAERALEYLEALSREAGSDAAVWTDVGSGYLRLGEVQGGSAVRNLGEYGKAAESFAKAKEIAERLLASDGRNVAAKKLLLNAERPAVMASLRGQERKAGLEQAKLHVAAAERFAREHPEDGDGARLVAEAHMLLGNGLVYNARHEESLAQWERALAMFEALPKTEYLHHRRVAGILQFICDEHLRRKDAASARKAVEKAVALQEEALRLYPQLITARMDLSLCHYQYAHVLGYEGKHEEASRMWERVIAARERLVEQEPTDVMGRAWLAGAHGHRGESLKASGRWRESAGALETSLGQYLELMSAEKGSERYLVAVAETEAELAEVYERLGRRAEACRQYRSARERFGGLTKEAKGASRNTKAVEAVSRGTARCGAGGGG